MDGLYPQEALVCPICMEVPNSEIFQCKNGHTVCHDCSQNLVVCPQCRVPFEQIKIRNRAMEDLLDSMRFDCANRSIGCTVKLSRQEISHHTVDCAFGNSTINFCEHLRYSCKFLVDTHDLSAAIEHFRRCHGFMFCRDKENAKVYLEETSAFSFKNKSFWTPVIFDFQKKFKGIWMLIPLISSDHKTIHPICINLGRDSCELSLDKIRVGIKIKALENCKRPEIAWSTFPLPLKLAQFELENPSFGFSLETLLSFYVQNSSLVINVSTSIHQTENLEDMIDEEIHIINVSNSKCGNQDSSNENVGHQPRWTSVQDYAVQNNLERNQHVTPEVQDILPRVQNMSLGTFNRSAGLGGSLRIRERFPWYGNMRSKSQEWPPGSEDMPLKSMSSSPRNQQESPAFQDKPCYSRSSYRIPRPPKMNRTPLAPEVSPKYLEKTVPDGSRAVQRPQEPIPWTQLDSFTPPKDSLTNQESQKLTRRTTQRSPENPIALSRTHTWSSGTEFRSPRPYVAGLGYNTYFQRP